MTFQNTASNSFNMNTTVTKGNPMSQNDSSYKRVHTVYADYDNSTKKFIYTFQRGYLISIKRNLPQGKFKSLRELKTYFINRENYVRGQYWKTAYQYIQPQIVLRIQRIINEKPTDKMIRIL